MYERILVPVDGSSASQRGFEEAMSLARQLGASLRVLNVVDARLLLSELSAFAAPGQLLDDWRAAGEQIVTDAVRRARDKGLAAEAAVLCDPGYRVCDLIVKEASDQHADLIVMGTHGRRGLRRLALGSDAEMVLRESPVPVLLVRTAEEKASP